MKDDFSQKTSSAGGYPVPLPTNILLFARYCRIEEEV
jgi:hypothetical protein